MKISDQEILKILSSNKIKDQSELASILHSKGLDINQSTLSRKLKKLNVFKINGLYKIPATQLATDKNSVIEEVKVAPPNIIVVRTSPGSAQSFAYYIDNNINGINNNIYNLSEFGVIATVAGDDTILIITNQPARLEETAKIIEEFASYF